MYSHALKHLAYFSQETASESFSDTVKASKKNDKGAPDWTKTQQQTVEARKAESIVLNKDKKQAENLLAGWESGVLADIDSIDLPARTAPISTESATPKVTEYTIRAGDTLSKIAKEHGTTIAALKEANQIIDVNKISIGKSLKIPNT
jgi:LysM repeat protein